MACIHFSLSLVQLRGHDWSSLNFFILCFVQSPDSSPFQTLLSRKVEGQVEGGICLTLAESAGTFLSSGPGRCLQLIHAGTCKLFRASPVDPLAVVPLRRPVLLCSELWLDTPPTAPRNVVFPPTSCCRDLSSPLGDPNDAKVSWLAFSPMWLTSVLGKHSYIPCCLGRQADPILEVFFSPTWDL